MTLAVLPGWNTFCTGMSVVAATLAGSDGLNVGYCASARICPVRGCITTTEQFVACAFLTSAAHACSAYHWMSAWIVSFRLPAGTGARSVCSVPGIGSASAPGVISACSLPSRPLSRELYSCSSPASPRRSPAASVSEKPMRFAARSPFG